MELIVTRHSSGLTIKPDFNRLDASLALQFKQACLRELSGESRLAIDLTDVDFIDSVGLGALVAIRKQLGDGAQFSIVAPRGGVRTLLELTRLDKVFRLLENAQDIEQCQP